MAKAYLDFKPITGLSGGDVEMNSTKPDGFAPGQLVLAHTAMGFLALQMVRFRNGSDVAQGDFMTLTGGAATAEVSFVATAGTTIQATTSGITANDFQGAIGFLEDGTASIESEYAICTTNSTTVVDFDADRPFTADISTDTISMNSVYVVQDCTAGNTNFAAAGAVIAEDGVTDTNYGWLACGGVTWPVKRGTTQTVGHSLIAATAALAVSSSSADDLLLGVARSEGTNATNDYVVAQLAVGPMTGQFKTQ